MNTTIGTIKNWLFYLVPVAVLIDVSHYLLRGNFKFAQNYLHPGHIPSFIMALGAMTVLPTLFVLITRELRISRACAGVAAALGLILAYITMRAGINERWIDVVATTFLPLGMATMLAALYRLFSKAKSQNPDWAKTYIYVLLFSAILALNASSFLEITPVLFPRTYDYLIYQIDAALGQPAVTLASMVLTAPEILRELLTLNYDLLSWLFIPLIALTVREGKSQKLNIWRTYIFSLALAIPCYAFIPVSGPLYAFGPAVFPNHMAEILQIPSTIMPVQPALRNGMPSMHLSSAIVIAFVCAALGKRLYFWLSLVFLALTAIATMSFGEHYLLDLVVALPYAAAIAIILINPYRYLQRNYIARCLTGAAVVLFLLWMVLIKVYSHMLISTPWLVQILTLLSVALFVAIAISYLRFLRQPNEEGKLVYACATNESAGAIWLKGNAWVVGVFFFSGFAGLVYEVVYAKALGVTFGGTALASNTVLMTYMGGMALGAWIGGFIAQRTKQPLMLYAVFEAAVGIYAALTPLFFTGIQSFYVMLALDSTPDAPWLTALRMGLGAAVLGAPTILMGATLPLVFQYLRRMGMATERAIAPLYGANVLGAAAGALVSGYVLLPALGRNGATYLAALLSLLVGLYVIDKLKRTETNPHQGLIGESSGAATVPDASAHHALPPTAAQGLVALGVLTIGGVVTLALEVVFIHLLAVVAGNSVYAFGLMLTTFLLGLGLGSTLADRLVRRIERIQLIVWSQAGIALSIILTSLVWDGLANYMGGFAALELYGAHLGFGARELIRALVCAIAMMPPAVFIGMSYPAAIGIGADWLAAARFKSETARGIGLASALNTLGNIAGVLLTAFWWLPMYGSRNVLVGLASTAIVLAALAIWVRSTTKTATLPWRWAPIAALVAGLGLIPPHWNFTALSQGGNVYFTPQNWGEVIDHAESVEGGLTTVTDAEGNHLTLLTNGKFQGNNSEGGEMVAQESFALIPLLHTAKRDDALVIGYGTGMTARVLQDQGFAKLDVVELSRDIVLLADKHFANINAGISHHPDVKMHYTDGRNYLLTQSRKFDLISLEISSIWFAGAANLYNREFYELARKRLRAGGVLQQWVQLHHMRPMDFLYILGSVRSVFDNVWIYVSGGQGIIVATAGERRSGDAMAVDKLLKSHTISDLKIVQLPETLVASPEKIDRLLHEIDPTLKVIVSTDKNLYLEYATPKGNAMREESLPILVTMLRNGSLHPLPLQQK